ncbi:Apolipoprotein N-acyltransferase / Copper homeostasis protein CutE [Castellaniella defragrans 65Phen]|uniref:Apolipoprotein N-acyltransferase n=1 Tax=Castellaniella defragrans (strain DSM 12143 / CCUG 39792 / 65Phen) TaxID=1437824 RepID=W8X5E4_CASD6|nr:apolipoprotein N-acyltransferase [Castellaniella defragrans]CDM25557.1 Apolipoprotein N-acyltransferase / Copper homeostasis protein CutE [Castellaniella defragrans 65Phen]
MPPDSAPAPRPGAPDARRAGRGRLAALLAGALQALCFAPGPLPAWSLPFAQIAALAVLAALTFGAPDPRRAAGLGWLFGLAQFGIGVYWLTTSMHEFGGLPLPLAIAALLLFAAAMAAYAAGACALTAWLCAGHGHPERRAPRQILNAVAWASAWTLAEWLRGTLFTGFTWLNAGYAHAEGMFAAWAPFAGVYGLAWLAAFSAAAAALMARAKDTAYDRSAAAVVGLALLAGLLGIAWSHVEWARPLGEPLMVRLVQPATPQSDKFQPELFRPTQERVQRLAALPPKSEPDRPAVVILPETVLPIFQDQVPEAVWRQWRAAAESMRATFVLGAPLHVATPAGDRYTNGAIALRPQAGSSAPAGGDWHYDKRHLVPFGEFIPPGFHWFVRAMQIPLGDFDRGPARQPPLAVGGQRLAIDICYEDTFGEEIAATVAPDGADAPGASILVNLSNLAWFGDGWALRQHLWIARMRALETARPMVRATNTGATAVIDARGQVRGALEPGRPGVLDAEVQGTEGLTPYVRWGNAPILAWTLLGLLLAVRARRRKEPASPPAPADAP